MTGILRVPRRAALTAISVLVAAASLVSFAESYRGLCDDHGADLDLTDAYIALGRELGIEVGQ